MLEREEKRTEIATYNKITRLKTYEREQTDEYMSVIMKSNGYRHSFETNGRTNIKAIFSKTDTQRKASSQLIYEMRLR